MALLSLIGRLGLDTSGFEGGLKKAESAATGFAGSMTAKVGGALAGAFSIAAVTAMANKINEAAVEVEHLAKQYSLTTDEVQLLQKATGKLGLEFGNVAGAIGRIQKARAIALGGGEQGDKALNLFGALGVSEANVLNPVRSVVDLMKEIAAQAEKGVRPLSAQKAEFELLGKNSIQLKSIMVELKNLGPVKLIDGDTINSALEAMKEAKRAQKEAMVAALPAASASSRFTAEFFSGMNMANKALGGGLLGALGAIVSSPVWIGTGLDAAMNGAPSTSDPDSTGEKMNRLNEARDIRRNRARERQSWNSFKEVEEIQAIQGIATRNGSGSLANVGGYFFGDQANQSLLSEAKRTSYTLEEIKQNTSKMLENFMPEGP